MKAEKKYYGSKEVPLQHVWNIHETGNFVWMLKNADYSELDQSDESIESFNQMNRDIVNKFGGSKEFMKLLKKKKKYLVMGNTALSKTPVDKYLLWRSDKLKAEIDKEETKENVDKEESLIIIGNFVCDGRMINPMEITYYMYHSYLNYAKKSIALKARNTRKGK